MKRHRSTPEQAATKLDNGEQMLSEGSDLTEALRKLEIANCRLKKLLEEVELDMVMLKESVEGKR